METSIEDRIASECERAFAGLHLDPDRVGQAVIGGRRRRRNRQVARGTGAVGSAAVLAAGGFLTLSSTRVEHTTTLIGSTPPGLATTASSASAQATVDVDGVSVGYLPAGYQLASETPPTSDVGLPCLRRTGAVFLPAGVSLAGVATAYRLMVTVTRGPVFFPNDGGGPHFGNTDLGLFTSPYSGPGTRRGFITASSVQLGPQLVVTVEGADIDTGTIQAVASGLVAGPADPTPASPAASDGATIGQMPPNKADEAHC